MTGVTYDEQTKLASIQPGVRWHGVYQELLKHHVCVTSGRDGNVGVGGFLTGGGISYHAGENGLGCDNVANFEVVLASGEIINANANSHADLWKELKGGSGNFGIVTRFELYTFPAPDVWGGPRITTRDQGDKLAKWTVDFTNENHKMPHTATILNYTFNLGLPGMISIVQMLVDTSGTTESPAFDSLLKEPAVHSVLEKQSMAQLVANSTLRPNQHQIWFTLTFKNDVEIIKHAAELHDVMVDELKSLLPSDHFSTQCIFQPWPKLFAQHSVRRGGNVLGLDYVKENSLLWAVVGSTDTAAEHAIMREKLTIFKTALEEFARCGNLLMDWQYLNYVDETQRPLESYGEKNINFIREVALKYDPTGMFQAKIVSGWKISKVGI
ncbi:FAD-binding domain-containing protein [Didymella exigua CBS 183.55]|uniref:FAD-binding domain-containing protein n=1 Tax=Didymella exigua CBS 183.55 TaxID=1150837 RepID=A0A6A5RMH4_9PLEO|nr:FAD-binding domain-containing protein [Didymella exigua CBS 183.55]KAF1926737.1 FAD-binding domain-containing protein [Didymella exigua CBS 183.55]